MSGVADVVTALKAGVATLGQLVKATQALTPANPPKYTVATLPTVTAANQGQFAYATNGRNTGEGSGAGTGCVVTVNSAGIWAAVWSGVHVVS